MKLPNGKNLKHIEICIIGSGISGLCIGALLSKKGYSVTVLEKHPESFGGHARSFKRKGFWFCCGPQYLWNFRNNKIGPRFLKYLGLTNKVPIESLDPNGFERCFIGNNDFIDIPMGLNRFKDFMINKFPLEKKNLEKLFIFIEASFETCDLINNAALYTEGAMKMLPFILFNHDIKMKSKFQSLIFSLFSLKKLFDYCKISQKARRILYAYGGIFLENESDVSCLAYGGTTGFYHKGADFPKLGFRNMIQSLVDCLRDNGGKVELNKDVHSLEISGKRIKSISCKDGSVYSPDYVISNIAPSLIKKMMIDPSLLKYNYLPSHPCVGLFIGIAGHPDLPKLMAKKNIWWQDGKKEVEYNSPDMRNPRMMYICSPTCNSLENKNDKPNYHSIMIFTAGNFNQDMEMLKKGYSEYIAFREQIQENHIEMVDKYILKDIRKYIKYVKLLTPADFNKEINLELGGVYGRRAISRNLLIKPIRRNKIKNLEFACAATGAAGIASGFQTAAVLFKKMTGEQI